MSDGECPICKLDYEKNTRKAFILLCGHSACSNCINYHKEAKTDLECGKCCKITQSANIEIQDAYKDKSSTQSNSVARNPEQDEFEIYIKTRQNNKFSILVKKTMTVQQLIDKIKEQEGIDSSTYSLAFRKPLIELKATLESYEIKKLVTVTMIAPFKGGNVPNYFS